MLESERNLLRKDIAELCEKYGHDRAYLLPILEAVQEKYRHVSDVAMQEIADGLGIHPVEVYSVVTFYAFLSAEPKGNFIIRLCRTISCDMAGKDAIARQLENELGIGFGETTPDGRFTLEWTNCLGMCDQGPAMMVNDVVFTQLTPRKVHEIISECRKQFGPYTLQEKEAR
ncbi:MAG: NADH-quinone oxidoreductase subunit NuoE [Planctomycetota bacterium]|nr:MAG: NADH-quinone oxidoreductase subunit NuoE [Planctomycetota bacterium]